MPPLLKLPSDIINLIINYLDLHSVIDFASTSRKLRHDIIYNRSFWQSQCRTTWFHWNDDGIMGLLHEYWTFNQGQPIIDVNWYKLTRIRMQQDYEISNYIWRLKNSMVSKNEAVYNIMKFGLQALDFLDSVNLYEDRSNLRSVYIATEMAGCIRRKQALMTWVDGMQGNIDYTDENCELVCCTVANFGQSSLQQSVRFMYDLACKLRSTVQSITAAATTGSELITTQVARIILAELHKNCTTNLLTPKGMQCRSPSVTFAGIARRLGFKCVQTSPFFPIVILSTQTGDASSSVFVQGKGEVLIDSSSAEWSSYALSLEKNAKFNNGFHQVFDVLTTLPDLSFDFGKLDLNQNVRFYASVIEKPEIVFESLYERTQRPNQPRFSETDKRHDLEHFYSHIFGLGDYDIIFFACGELFDHIFGGCHEVNRQLVSKTMTEYEQKRNLEEIRMIRYRLHQNFRYDFEGINRGEIVYHYRYGHMGVVLETDARTRMCTIITSDGLFNVNEQSLEPTYFENSSKMEEAMEPIFADRQMIGVIGKTFNYFSNEDCKFED
ncbi:hypothetical protein V1514DRAFT_335301 [Lipomyces japonicus]|uniref:uncharacterized protein n=1 Tax=Lipomyces japonicus TaxID=56871 RepID=UPI0034CF2015